MTASDLFENFLLHDGLKSLRPKENPPILRFVSPETTRQADTPQAALFRLWGRGAACSRRAGGGAFNSPASVKFSSVSGRVRR